MSGLRPLRARHADGVRRRAAPGRGDAGRGAAGRRRGHRRATPSSGPAGRLLDRALEEAGIDRTQVYVTNVVKHFKWEPRGKRRIHAKPNAAEIAACRPWLETRDRLVKPRVLVCLGATAAQALLGTAFKVSRSAARSSVAAGAASSLATVIRRRSCARRTTRRAARRWGGSSPTCAIVAAEIPRTARPGQETYMTNFRPTLLLSMPQLQDPNFARTVVLLCDYTAGRRVRAGR